MVRFIHADCKKNKLGGAFKHSATPGAVLPAVSVRLLACISNGLYPVAGFQFIGFGPMPIIMQASLVV